MSDLQTKVVVGAVVAATGVAATLAYLNSRKDEPIPTKWKKIGKIVDLNFFPVKSCAPIKEDAFECHQLGIADGEFFDRCFIVSGNDKQITARIYPKMVLIRPKVVGNQLILSAPGKDDFVIDLDELKNKTITAKVACWYSTVKGIDVGDDAAEWLSEFIAGKSQALRLLYYPYLHPTKGKAAKDKIYKQFSANDAGTYHDSTSYMMINQASIDEINTHLDHVVKPLQFRPNFVVKGPGAYAEDTWKWVRIGPNVVFRVLKPCTRCIFTNISPETGERNPKREPLETLIKNRTLIPKEAPVMGIHLGVRLAGRVSIDDEVYIDDESSEHSCNC